MDKSSVVVNESNQVGWLRLNAETSLNALTMEMVEELTAKIREWNSPDSRVQVIVLDGAGAKAFCAGGDIVKLYQGLKDTSSHYPETFFRKEYALDYLIHSSAKPILVWGNGIVMGGGLGLMAGASHRVVTDRTKLAMPEISIGLFPDVGASWFLNQMPQGVGLYLGLTGTRLNAADTLYCKLADHYIHHSAQAEVYEKIQAHTWSHNSEENKRKLSTLLQTFEPMFVEQMQDGEIEYHQKIIQKLMSHAKDFSAMIEVWKQESFQDPWIALGLKTLLGGSPTSAKVICEQLRRSVGLTKKQCFEQEFWMACQFSKHTDLVEGIRALLIDKDGKPAWSPSAWDQVSSSLVSQHFEPISGMKGLEL